MRGFLRRGRWNVIFTCNFWTIVMKRLEYLRLFILFGVLFLFCKSLINVYSMSGNKMWTLSNETYRTEVRAGMNWQSGEHLPKRVSVPEAGVQGLVRNKIFWSEHSESFVPKGLPFNESMQFVKNIRGKVVKSLRQASWRMCGVGKNAIAVFNGGTVMCVRYPEKPERVAAEALAFYLSRMLQMDNVPEVVLERVNQSAKLWRDVDIETLSWKDGAPVAFIRRVSSLGSEALIPQILEDAYLSGKTITSEDMRSSGIKNSTLVADVIQWGSLFVYEYLTCPFDRLYKWRDEILKPYTGHLHNTVQSHNGKLWIVDNEKSILYVRLIYSANESSNLVSEFHAKFLQTVCIFQYPLIKRLERLSKQPSPFRALWNFTRAYEPLLEVILGEESFQSEIYAELFDNRVVKIMQWIRHCK